MEKFDFAVIGSGGAGTMAFLRGVLNFDRVALFSGDASTQRQGRALWVMEVDNMPGMHDLKRPITQTTRSTLEWLNKQSALKDRGQQIKASVARIEKSEDGFILHFEEKKESKKIWTNFVVLATGIMDRQPEISGSIAPILPYANRGDALYCIRCDGHKTIGKKLSVVTQSSTGVHIAALMKERYGHEKISILTHGQKIDWSKSARDILNAYGFEVHEEKIMSILGDPKKEGLAGFVLQDQKKISTNQSIIALGIIAYNQLLLDLGGHVDESGRALVSEKYESNIPGLFVVGDLVAGKKMQIYTSWDMAVDAADEINCRLRKIKRDQKKKNSTN